MQSKVTKIALYRLQPKCVEIYILDKKMFLTNFVTETFKFSSGIKVTSPASKY